MKALPGFGALLLAAGCVYEPPMPPVAYAPAPAGSSQAAGPVCHEYPIPETVDGKTVQAKGRACQQPDGSWLITQEAPGLPIQTYTVAQGGAGAPAVSAAAAQPPPNCRDYTLPVTIDGNTVQAKGHACQQPDGSWQVTQETPGLPAQTYTVAAPPPYPVYPYPAYAWEPDWWWPPFFFGGDFFFRDHDRFFHRRFVRDHDHDHDRDGHHFAGGGVPFHRR